MSICKSAFLNKMYYYYRTNVMEISFSTLLKYAATVRLGHQFFSKWRVALESVLKHCRSLV